MNTSTGAAAERVDYDEFGNVLADSAPGFQPFGFAGGLQNLDTGLTRFGSRDYDPVMARWTGKDPLTFGGGLSNLYSYVGADPVSRTDPKGLDILVIENGPTGGNPVGHTAIAVTGEGVFSFGNDMPLGANVDTYLAREAQRRDSWVFVVETTPEQDAAALAVLWSYGAKPLGLFQDNCSSRSNSALDAAGIRRELFSNAPGTAGSRALLWSNATAVFIPRGSDAWMNPVLRQFNSVSYP